MRKPALYSTRTRELLAPLVEQVGLADAALIHRGGLAAEGEALPQAVGVTEGLAVGVVLKLHRVARGTGEGSHGVVEIGAVGGGVIRVSRRFDFPRHGQWGVDAHQVAVGIGVTEGAAAPVGDAGDEWIIGQ